MDQIEPDKRHLGRERRMARSRAVASPRVEITDYLQTPCSVTATWQKKAGHKPGFSDKSLPKCRSVVLTGLIDQLHQRHWRRIARAMSHLQDTQIATRPVFVARSEFVEQLADGFLVAEPVKCTTAARYTVLFRHGDQRLNDTAQF